MTKKAGENRARCRGSRERKREKRNNSQPKDKSSGPSKGSAREKVRISKEPADVVQVRKNVNNMVWNAAETIAAEVIKVAMSGQLAAVKYLFEAVGMYPAPKEIEEKPRENSLAYMLLKRLGIPTEPMTCDDDLAENGDTVE
jgi:hypothetical protein